MNNQEKKREKNYKNNERNEIQSENISFKLW